MQAGVIWCFGDLTLTSNSAAQSKPLHQHAGDLNGTGKAAAPPPLPLPPTLTAFLPADGPLSPDEFRARLLSTDGTQEVPMPRAGLVLRYAFVSFRGLYPEAPGKANQDAVCAYRRFANDAEQAFFGVFDGHGMQGTACAQFAKEKVPTNLVLDPAFAAAPEEAFVEALLATNDQLHHSAVDDAMSGTTAVSALVRGRTLYVANVGDSRAVLAERAPGGRLTAVPLSYDHTPFRQDECVRVKKYGTRILTLDQIEGIKDPSVQCWGNEAEDSGDPPRLWAPNALYPGTAFTRSVGDSAAERLGVVAEPEVIVRHLGLATAFVVLASDGVFEFMSNQEVVGLAAAFEDPQEAAVALVVEAYRLWLQYETRTDDITAIVIQVNVSAPRLSGSQAA